MDMNVTAGQQMVSHGHAVIVILLVLGLGWVLLPVLRRLKRRWHRAIAVAAVPVAVVVSLGLAVIWVGAGQYGFKGFVAAVADEFHTPDILSDMSLVCRPYAARRKAAPLALETFPPALRAYYHRNDTGIVQFGRAQPSSIALELAGHFRTFEEHRKKDELALRFDAKYSKDDLEMIYLNTVSFDKYDACGFAEGAEAYFGKPLENLTLGELASLISVASYPHDRDKILSEMVERSILTQEQAEQARQEPLVATAQSGRT